MTEIIVVPNGIWKKLGEISKLLESRDVTQLPDEVKKGTFQVPPVIDDDLLPLMQARIDQWFTANTDLVLGSSDFLPANVLDKGLAASKAVCCLLRRFTDQDLDKIIELAQSDGRIRGIAIKLFSDQHQSVDPVASPDEFKQQAKNKDVPCATGFLVGNNYLLTNHHVVDDVLAGDASLSDFSAVFDYEVDLANATFYKFDPVFCKPAENPDLDYVLLKLQPLDGVEAGERFKPIPVVNVDIIPKPTPSVLARLSKPHGLLDEVWADYQSQGLSGDLVNIVQHPEGRAKEIVIFNNRLTTLYPDFLVYESDAQPGSSGSPLFNARWELIGLHQAALLNPEAKRVTGYLGIRMSSILSDLETQATSKPDAEIQAFLDSLSPQVVTTTVKKQVFVLAGRDRSSILGTKRAELEKAAMLQLQQKVQAALNMLDPAITITLISGSGKNLKEAIQTINGLARSSTNQSVAVELLTDAYDNDPKVSGISVYYSGRDDKGKKYASSLLKGIREKAPALPIFIVGAFSDQVTKRSGLAFCRQTNMPALVFYAGYLSNASDRARIEALQSEAKPLAEAIANGLLKWLNEIVLM